MAADLRRPAAVEQLRVLSEQTGVDFYAEDGATDPVRVVSGALKYAGKAQLDTVLIDTAGRLQADKELMAELAAIRKKADPQEVLLVADAMTGQNAVEIAKEFDQQIGVTGVVLSKLDSDTRGGAALSIRSVTGKPIKFVGTGEHVDSLEPFYPDRLASRILGMGDVVTLVEKVQETMNQAEALELQQKFESRTFTLQDFLEQFQRVRKMGSLQSIAEMIPGLSVADQTIDEGSMKRDEAIILSMTRGERRNHRIVGPPRRRRIAKGSGTSVHEVNRLLKQFEKTKQMMRKMTKNAQLQKHMLMGNVGGMR